MSFELKTPVTWFAIRPTFISSICGYMDGKTNRNLRIAYYQKRYDHIASKVDKKLLNTLKEEMDQFDNACGFLKKQVTTNTMAEFETARHESRVQDAKRIVTDVHNKVTGLANDMRIAVDNEIRSRFQRSIESYVNAYNKATASDDNKYDFKEYSYPAFTSIKSRTEMNYMEEFEKGE